MSNPDLLENLLKKHIEKNKIRSVLERLQSYTGNEDYIDVKYAENVVQAIYNISDLLPNKRGMWDFGADLDAIRVIFQILKRQEEIIKNYEIFKNTISRSKGLSGPVETISLESKTTEDNRLIPVERINELQLLCVNKIKEFSDNGKLIVNKDFISILFRWKEWDNTKEWEIYVERLVSTDEGLIIFVEKFVYEKYSQTVGQYLYRTTKEFGYDDLSEFIEPETVKYRLQKIKQTNNFQYESKKEILDIFLSNFDENFINFGINLISEKRADK